MAGEEAGDFLFTWKADKWPYERLKALVDRFRSGEGVIENWRCQSHRQVRAGSGAYLYKQGDPPNGIFGIARAVGGAIKRTAVQEGENDYEVPLRFELLLDPVVDRFVVSKEQLQAFPEQVNLNTQASGISLPASIARAIDAIAGSDFRDQWLPATAQEADPLPPEKRERMTEVYERDQGIVGELKRLYGGRCQICDSAPFNNLFGSIVEGHHIEWLCRGGADVRENIVLLCPNHHAAIHAANPKFDWSKLEFQFGVKTLPIRANQHLNKRAPLPSTDGS